MLILHPYPRGALAASSAEIKAARHKSELGSPAVQQIKAEWPKARVVA